MKKKGALFSVEAEVGGLLPPCVKVADRVENPYI